MRLRVRMLLVVGAAMVALFILLLLVTAGTLRRQFVEFETRSALVDAERMGGALNGEIAQLDRVARDIAPRDEARAFMLGDTTGHLRGYLREETLANLGANVIAFVADDGRVLRADFVDLDLGTRADPETATIEAIESAEVLRRPGDPRARASGLLRLPDGVMLVAARAITSSDMYAPPAGTLVLGRYLDSSEVEHLAAMTRLSIAAFPIGADDTPDDVTDARAALEGTPSVWAVPLSGEVIGAYSLARDVEGEPALILRAEVPRDIMRQGDTAVYFLVGSLLVIGAAATASVFVAVDHSVLRRLARLSGQVAELTKRSEASGRVTVEGEDELARLATDINDMLVAKEASERRVREARDTLEVRVQERTSELRTSESRYRTLVERMADAVFSVSPEGIITFVNGRACELTGRSAEQLLGLPFRDLMTHASADDVERRLKARRGARSTLAVEANFLHAQLGPLPVELRAAPVVGGDLQVAGVQWIVHDIAQRKRYESELVHLASHDYLTGLYNRRYFEEALERELQEVRRSGSSGGVLWLDVDDFKDINDSLGHRVGDEVLIQLAEQLRQQVREYNVLARLGGDEFGVLVPDASPEEAEAAADRILTSVNSRTYSVSGHAIRVGASMGVVLFPAHGSTVEELLAKADVAMYRAKSAGRSRMHMHQTEIETSEGTTSRVEWNERLVLALEQDKLQVYAQPILDIRSGEIDRYELLIRLEDESGNIVLPAEFLPTAERLGLIRDIDRWILHRAVGLLAGHPGPSLKLDVNLSGKAFADTGLLATVAQELSDAGIEPSRLGFEITETAAVADILRAQEFICTLSDIGCRFSLDDFGSGFSSFYYLKHLPIDCLKVDGSFIRAIHQSEQDRHLVRGMVELCRGLGVEVAAEYVESKESFEVVESLGFDFAQGYEIGRPRPVDEVFAPERTGQEG